jgi:hypothetical protein
MFVRRMRRRRSGTFPRQERVITEAPSIIAAGLLITLGAAVGTGGSASAGGDRDRWARCRRLALQP